MHRLLLLALVTTACVADTGDEGFVVLNNVTPGEGCSVMVGATSSFTPRGTIFLGSPQPYTLTPLIESRITATDTNVSQRTVALQGARVDLSIEAITVANGDDVTRVDFSDAEIEEMRSDGTLRFSSLFSAPLAPGGQSTAIFDIVSVSALAAVRAKTAGMTGTVRAQFVAKSIVYGMLGSDEVESVPYTYPVTACTDCVVNTIGDCPPPDGIAIRQGNGCNAFQDGIVDCCIDRSVTPAITRCPAAI